MSRTWVAAALPEGDDEKVDGPAKGPERPQIPPKPERFREPDSVDYYLALIAAGKPKRAGAYLLEILPEVAAGGLNHEEKINHLIYLPRLLQRSGATKHGVNKLLRKVRGVENNIAGIDVPKGGAFVDFGCGAHDPVAMSTYYYANGFEKAYAIDLLPPRNELYTALSMYDLVASMRLFPQRYCRPGVEPGEILHRIRVLNAQAFEEGDFRRGMARAADKIRYEPVDIVQSTIEPESVALLVSFAVFEHVSDINAVCSKIYEVLLPGGVAYHFVDMADHRSYRGDGQFGPLSFLTEDVAPPNMNRLRKTEQLAAQAQAGFDIVKAAGVNAELTNELRSGLVERFRNLDDDDVSTIKLHLTVRKPARMV